jgi:alpha-tubulin suppressor-like RCC1 family protein
VDLGAGVEVKDIALGDYHTCALLSTGAIRCWGLNNYGQLGYGNSQNMGDNEALTGLADVSLPGPVRKVVAGPAHTCALMENGALRCWGYGGDGRTGYGFRSSNNYNYGDQSGETPLNLPDINIGAVVTDVTAGDSHTCALASDGSLKCWGSGANGQLGYGNGSNQGTPPAAGVDLDGVSAYQLTAGLNHTCALRSNGTARCWGNGGSGRLGLGNTSTIYSPVAGGDVQIFAP